MQAHTVDSWSKVYWLADDNYYTRNIEKMLEFSSKVLARASLYSHDTHNDINIQYKSSEAIPT